MVRRSNNVSSMLFYVIIPPTESSRWITKVLNAQNEQRTSHLWNQSNTFTN